MRITKDRLAGFGLGFLWQFRRACRLSVFLVLLLVGGCRSEPRQDSASEAGGQIEGDAKVESIQPADQEILLGLSERDLTGDGKAEILRVIGVGRTIDDLDADFTIESSGTTVYRFKLHQLTRTVGFDAGRRVISAEEHRLRLNDFGPWFFAQEKFQRPAEFVDWLRMAAPGRLAEIPDVIARDGQNSDPRTGSAIWDEILKSPGTIFRFSPGGDEVVAIGWSAVAGRFYRILECC